MGGIYLSRQDDLQTFHDNLATAKSPGSGWHSVEIDASAGTLSAGADPRCDAYALAW